MLAAPVGAYAPDWGQSTGFMNRTRSESQAFDEKAEPVATLHP